MPPRKLCPPLLQQEVWEPHSACAGTATRRTAPTGRVQGSAICAAARENRWTSQLLSSSVLARAPNSTCAGEGFGGRTIATAVGCPREGIEEPCQRSAVLMDRS